MFTVIAFILVLGILVLVHELGHFVTARKLGVDVEEFGIGFPPRMFKVKRKGIIYSLNWIPLGGFVRIKGESGDHTEDPDSFAVQKAWKKALILSAGVIMNFILAFVFLSIAFWNGLPQSIGDDVPQGVRDRQVLISQVLEDSAAKEAGVEPGDVIRQIDGQTPVTSDDVQKLIQSAEGESVNLIVDRRGEEFSFDLTPRESESEGRLLIGVGMVNTGIIEYGFFEGIWQGAKFTVIMIGRVFQAFYGLIVELVGTGRVTAELSGPVGVAVLTGQMVKLGIVFALQFMAILSINLGVLNILPFPALDGGRLLFVLIEAVSRRKLNQKVEAWIHNSGFILLILLIIFITFKDIGRFFGS